MIAKKKLLYRYVWYVGRDRLLTNERTLGIIDDVIHHYFSFWKEGEKYGKKARASDETEL